LGVGANTAIFSIVKAMLLAPLPYPEGDRLVMVWEDVPRWDIPRNTPAPANFLDWRSQNHVFESMAAFIGGGFGDVALTGAGDPEQIHGAQVTSNFFRVLRVRPALGSDFQDNDDQTGARIAIISDSLWRRRFAASRDIIGRSIALNGNGYTIGGVMPPSFAYPHSDRGVDTARNEYSSNALSRRSFSRSCGQAEKGHYRRARGRRNERHCQAARDRTPGNQYWDRRYRSNTLARATGRRPPPNSVVALNSRRSSADIGLCQYRQSPAGASAGARKRNGDADGAWRVARRRAPPTSY